MLVYTQQPIIAIPNHDDKIFPKCQQKDCIQYFCQDFYSVSLFSYRLSKQLAHLYTVHEPVSRPSRREHERKEKYLSSKMSERTHTNLQLPQDIPTAKPQLSTSAVLVFQRLFISLQVVLECPAKGSLDHWLRSDVLVSDRLFVHRQL